MDCDNCVNYEPKREPPFPQGLRTKDLKVGMLVTAGNRCPDNNFFYVILDEPGEASVRILKGYKTQKYDISLANRGCQPYKNGKWDQSNWLKEVK